MVVREKGDMRGKQKETRLTIRRSRFFWRRFSPRNLFFRFKNISPVRRNAFIIAALLIIAEAAATIHYLIPETSYALGSASKLLSPVSQQMASRVTYDESKQAYLFNQSQQELSNENTGIATTNQAKMTAFADPKKGISVNDPANGVDFTMKPLFEASTGKRDGNRVVYPLGGGKDGWAVYSLHAVGVKEDIILNTSDGEKHTICDEYILKIKEDGAYA